MAVPKDEFLKKIEEALPGTQFELNELVPGGDYFELKIGGGELNGLKTLEANRLINERLKDYIGAKVHALSIKIIKTNQ